MILGADLAPVPQPKASGISPTLIGGTVIDVAIVSLVDRKAHPFWWWFGMIGLAMNSATLAVQLGKKT